MFRHFQLKLNFSWRLHGSRWNCVVSWLIGPIVSSRTSWLQRPEQRSMENRDASHDLSGNAQS
jgi:hypothetical protein